MSIEEMTMKRCPKCGEEKERDLFSYDKTRKDGLYIYCKSCCNEFAKQLRVREKNELKVGIIYKYVHLSTNRCYVGSSLGKKRKKEHLFDLKNKKHSSSKFQQEWDNDSDEKNWTWLEIDRILQEKHETIKQFNVRLKNLEQKYLDETVESGLTLNECLFAGRPPRIDQEYLEKHPDTREKLLSTRRRGEENPSAKTTSENVKNIRCDYVQSKMSLTELVEKYGLSMHQICNIVNNIHWRESTFVTRKQNAYNRVSIIRDKYCSGVVQVELAKEFDLTQAQISNIVRNVHWFDPNYIPPKNKNRKGETQ